jgi:hypothetical protein
VKGASAIVVTAFDGLFRAIRCIFKECSKTGVDIRSDGCAELEDCVFVGCTAQAVTIYGKGKKLTMTRCTFTKCGRRPDCAAVMIETGEVVMRDCVVSDCPGDAIVMQERVNIAESPEPPAHLIMSGCSLERNLKGVGFYFGSGTFSKNTISNNAEIGMIVTHIAKDRKLIMGGNIFANNGTPPLAVVIGDLVVRGRTLYNQSMMVKPDNVFQVAPLILSDAASAAMRSMTEKQIQAKFGKK